MIGQDNTTFAADLRAVARGTGGVSPSVLHSMMLEAADRLDSALPFQRLFPDEPQAELARRLPAAESPT